MTAKVASEYLKETTFFDFNHPLVQAYLDDIIPRDAQFDEISTAIRLYKRVRDDIRYDPYTLRFEPSNMSASNALAHRATYCIPKAVLLGALARARGIPSRLGLADVTNHISDSKMLEWLKSDIFVMHGFIELHLAGKWVKATPAFNAGLCERLGVAPLEFNGIEDSVFQQFTSDGRTFMKYLRDHGTFADVPFEFIIESLQQAYPHLRSYLERREE